MATILFIDDDIDVREAISEALREFGHQVLEADHGKQALRKYEGHSIDLILTDIYMPEMDGLEVVKHFRKNPEMKIIAISGGSLAGDAVFDTAKALGADRTFRKPFSFYDVLEAIKELLPQ